MVRGGMRLREEGWWRVFLGRRAGGSVGSRVSPASPWAWATPSQRATRDSFFFFSFFFFYQYA